MGVFVLLFLKICGGDVCVWCVSFVMCMCSCFSFLGFGGLEIRLVALLHKHFYVFLFIFQSILTFKLDYAAFLVWEICLVILFFLKNVLAPKIWNKYKVRDRNEVKSNGAKYWSVLFWVKEIGFFSCSIGAKQKLWIIFSARFAWILLWIPQLVSICWHANGFFL